MLYFLLGFILLYFIFKRNIGQGQGAISVYKILASTGSEFGPQGLCDLSLVWWCMLRSPALIPAVGRCRQADLGLTCLVSPRKKASVAQREEEQCLRKTLEVALPPPLHVSTCAQAHAYTSVAPHTWTLTQSKNALLIKSKKALVTTDQGGLCLNLKGSCHLSSCPEFDDKP